MNYESALRRKKCISNIIAYASKSRNFGKKTNPQTISIIARRTRAFVVFVYALHGIDIYALAPRVRIREVCQLPDLQTYSLGKVVRFIGHHKTQR